MITQRRSLLFGLGATLLAAPSIVRVAANLMPVSVAHVPTQPSWSLIGMPAADPVVYVSLTIDEFRRLVGPGMRGVFREGRSL